MTLCLGASAKVTPIIGPHNDLGNSQLRIQILTHLMRLQASNTQIIVSLKILDVAKLPTA